MMIVQMEVEQLQVQEEAIEVEREQEKEEYRVNTQVRKKNTKILKRFNQRLVTLAWLRWVKSIQEQRTKEGKAKLVLERMRKNYLQSCFNKYRHQINQFPRYEVFNRRADNLIHVVQMKNMLK